MRLVTILKVHSRIRGRTSFLTKLSANPRVLDVGCGNAPPIIKQARPDIYYVGLDVHQGKDSSIGIADEYIVTTPEAFPEEIEQRENTFDAVVSSHNIEHCSFPERTLRAAVRALKKGGKFYLAFPCQKSKFFPSRRGTLNFFDDPTHRYLPDLKNIVAIIQSEGGTIDFCTERYRPVLLFIVGLLLEPLSALTKRCMPLTSTYSLYGFETIIWATRTFELNPTDGCGEPVVAREPANNP
jgi:SAM-dependent methyltransferase